MKIKLDENLPEALIARLAELDHETDNARLEGISGKPDATLWQAAQKAGRFLSPRIWIFPMSGNSHRAHIMD
jgi:predicted nuclease of predicted toxin-antitoxin system